MSVANDCTRLHENVVGQWATDLTELSHAVSEWCPAWQPFKETLLDKSNEEVVQQLLTNSEFPKLNGGAAALTQMLRELRQLQADGFGPWVDAKIIKDANSMKDLAVDTICITFATHNWFCKIRTEPNCKGRKQMIDTLRTDMKERGCPVPKDIDQALSQAAEASFKHGEIQSEGSIGPANVQAKKKLKNSRLPSEAVGTEAEDTGRDRS